MVGPKGPSIQAQAKVLVPRDIESAIKLYEDFVHVIHKFSSSLFCPSKTDEKIYACAIYLETIYIYPVGREPTTYGS